MRHIFLAVALAVAPIAGAVAGCASVESIKPRNARAAYAEAEVFLIGAINTADMLAARGVISQQQLSEAYGTFVKIAHELDGAYRLIQAGDAIAALAKIDVAQLDLDRLALALSMAAEAATAAAKPAAPVVWRPSSI